MKIADRDSKNFPSIGGRNFLLILLTALNVESFLIHGRI